jgi:hypothetical protein
MYTFSFHDSLGVLLLAKTSRFNFQTLASDEQDEFDKDIEQWKLFHIER